MPGLSFLSKKSWHTSNLDNQERVWLAEQKAASEAQKTKELQGMSYMCLILWMVTYTFICGILYDGKVAIGINLCGVLELQLFMYALSLLYTLTSSIPHRSN